MKMTILKKQDDAEMTIQSQIEDNSILIEVQQ
jgi:hypothetical protein